MTQLNIAYHNIKATAESVPWAKFYLEKIDPVDTSTSSDLLPLIDDSINPPTMVARCIQLSKKIVSYNSPQQVPVLTRNQSV